jgi:hypothetical protein
MSVLTVIATILYVMVVGEFVINILNTIKQAKELKASGKTPLTMKSLITVTVVGIFEGLVILVLTYLISRFGFNQDRIDFVVIVFLIIYMIRTAVAYLIAWGVWAIFVAIDSKKMKKKLDEQRERVL